MTQHFYGRALREWATVNPLDIVWVGTFWKNRIYTAAEAIGLIGKKIRKSEYELSLINLQERCSDTNNYVRFSGLIFGLIFVYFIGSQFINDIIEFSKVGHIPLMRIGGQSEAIYVYALGWLLLVIELYLVVYLIYYFFLRGQFSHQTNIFEFWKWPYAIDMKKSLFFESLQKKLINGLLPGTVTTLLLVAIIWLGFFVFGNALQSVPVIGVIRSMSIALTVVLLITAIILAPERILLTAGCVIAFVGSSVAFELLIYITSSMGDIPKPPG